MTKQSIAIVAVVEKNDTAGPAPAKMRGIANLSIDERVGMGEDLDILFDLTDVPGVRQELRDKLLAAGNCHTIIATENIAHVVWTPIASGVDIPRVPASAGY
jgi:hypothetical protein